MDRRPRPRSRSFLVLKFSVNSVLGGLGPVFFWSVSGLETGLTNTKIRVKSIQFDGAKEFTQGVFAKHLATRGIAVQVTAPYAHSQAGKAERYIRTIEDGIQTLLADAKLPPSFWGDAALTYQYLQNRVSTSTLPHGITPYKVMNNTKPDQALTSSRVGVSVFSNNSTGVMHEGWSMSI